MQDIITLEKIKDMALRLSLSASKPEFLNELLSIQKSDKKMKMSIAKKVATVDNVKSKGVPVDSDFRLTTRSFEDPILYETINDNESKNSPKIYFEDDHGFFEHEGTHIYIVDKEKSKVQQGNNKLTPDEIQKLIQNGIEEIGDFIIKPAFLTLLNELYSLPSNERFNFVVSEILNKNKVKQRNIIVPNNMKIQRSHFDDDRPTLFCVTKYIDSAYPWHKVTITFDNELVG